MVRHVLGCCLFFCVVLGCNPEAKEIEIGEFGAAGNSLHLIPFACSYLGVEISELSGCFVACPGAVLATYDLRSFAESLVCTHPSYTHLQCRLTP